MKETPAGKISQPEANGQVNTNGQSWEVEDNCQEFLLTTSANDKNAFCLQIKTLKQLYGSYTMQIF